MNAMRTGVNRVLLALAGLLLLALGGAVLAVGLGAPPPSWWLHTGPHDVLLTRAERTRWRHIAWWWPAVIAALALLVLLALWWLAAAVRRRRLTDLPVDTGDGAGARLRGRALESALAAEAAGLPGVARAHVDLRGRRTSPQVRAGLRLEPHAVPGETLTAFTTEALAHARESAGLASLPAEVRLTEAGHRAERVV
ncbi:alkaline shock response membrane anchor protein AmaP [Streptomyces sp. SP2-10]|uniref:alkaline shock response membrane anchor protein AmaP n=1 Tax=Streptomyces sp. SP2-10 TaxID=2873385 RepID=UPI001CA73F88|nr:alkaline shock response membrane anchor protein AmaP [Streptomyces sp. SP2-10]MBY8846394.1 alkaline shock response membrane anchor protein AmaP [Streptomyces sp. SP2-10]